jgi:hypothetical protein
MTVVQVLPQELGTSKGSQAVSMSWWLSDPIQLHLHQQIEDDKNDNHYGPRLKIVCDALTETSNCATVQPR